MKLHGNRELVLPIEERSAHGLKTPFRAFAAMRGKVELGLETPSVSVIAQACPP
jgi:hypothetical protein